MDQYSTTAILIAALLLWGIAMSAATWARFRHVSTRLTRPAALLLSGGLWLGVFIILVSGDHYAGNTVSAGIFFVALACYAILRIGNKPPAGNIDDKQITYDQIAPSGFDKGMLLSISLGVFIFASQFGGTEYMSGEHRINLPAPASVLTEEKVRGLIDTAGESNAAREQRGSRTETTQQPTARATDSRAIRLEDGWNISLLHYDQSSNTVQIEAVTAQPSGSDMHAYDNTLKSAPNNWHRISNVRVVDYPDEMPATWIEVELSEDDISTLRFAAETGAISIYSE